MKRFFTHFCQLALTIFATVFLGLSAVNAQSNAYADAGLSAPTVTSDKDDYAPGEIAYITGTGWTLDQSVHVEFKETPDYPDYHIYDVNVDADGNWKIDYQVEIRHLGVTFNVIAVGKQSLDKATTVFTDAGKCLLSVSASGGGSFCLNTTAVVSATYTTSGNGNDPTKFQWYSNSTNSNSGGTLISNATANSYTAPTSATGTLYYYCILTSTNGVCGTTTNQTSLTTTPVLVEVVDNGTLTLTSATGTNNQALCVNNAITTITYSVGGSATGASVSGLPAGVSSTYNQQQHRFTISGTPTATGTFNYTVTTSGSSCANPTLSGSIVVNSNGTLAFTSATGTNNQTLCVNKAITNITYSVGGSATGASVSGLPVGVSGSFSGTVFTISGTPTQTGTFNYTVITTGSSCNNPSLTGKIVVNTAVTTAVAGPNQLNAVGTSTTLAGNTPTVGTGTWSIVSGTGGSFGSTSTNPTATFNGTVGETYTLRWTITNGSCTSFDDVQVLFNQIITTTSTTSPSTPYGSTSVTLSATVNPNPGGGSVDFYVNTTKVGTGTVGASGDATYTYDPSSLNAVNYTISAKYTGYGVYIASTSTTGTLAITKAPLTVKADNQSKTYDGKTFTVGGGTFTSTITGFVKNETSSVVTGSASYSGSATTATGFGTYTITPAAGTLSATNYSFTNFSAGSLQINKAPLSVKADNKSREYGAANPTFIGTLTGVVNGDAVTDAYTTTATATTGVGDYAIVADVNGTATVMANYSLTKTNGTLTITKAALSVTAADKSREYGDANPALTGNVTGEKNGETFTATYSTTAVATSAVGDYNITPAVTGATLSNYTVDLNKGTLKITAAALVVTAADKSREYGDANPALTGSYSGQKNSETFTISGSTTATATSVVGSYTIVPSVTGATLSNYDVIKVNGTLTIEKATLTITAADKGRQYGDANPAFTGSFSGQKNNETFTVGGSTTAVATSAVGSYTIVPSVTGTTLSNYNVTSVNGTLTITKAILTITAADKSRQYGIANPAFTGSYSGQKNSETFTISGSTTATAASAIGSYAIVPSVTGATLSNYNVTPVNGTFTITKATLTITAADKSRQYSDPNPAFTGSYSGQMNSETFTVTGSTTATATSAVGSYTIVPSVTGTTLSNYNVTPINGTLTITQENATVDYSGLTYFSTASATSCSAIITLSATVTDNADGSRGDIRNAKVTFHSGSISGPVLGTANLQPVLINSSDSTVGTVSTTFTYTLSSNDCANKGTSFEVYAVVDNYYTGNNNGTPGMVTVSVPGSDAVTGGGYLKMTNSIGTYAGTSGTKTNFGFTMKYTKSGSSAKGQCNIIIRSNNKTYQIKSNAINSLSTRATTTTGTPASFTTKANLTDITNPLSPVTITGNLDLFVNMNDSSTGGKGDQVSILLQNGSTILYSSNWNGTKTILQTLGGGNVQVKNAATTIAAPKAIKPTEVPIVEIEPLTLKAYPNPSTNYFTMKLQSRINEKVQLKVFDASGRPVYLTEGSSNQTYRFGDNFTSGTYFLNVIQGEKQQVLKLIKLK